MKDKQVKTKWAWFQWVFGVTALLYGLVLFAVSSQLDLWRTLCDNGTQLLETVMRLLIGDITDLFSETAVNAFLFLGVYMVLTWFVWLACRRNASDGYRALTPATIAGTLCALLCTVFTVLFYGSPLRLFVLCRFGGVLLMVEGLALYRFLCDKFPAVFNQETIRYLVFGVLTTAVNLVTYNFCDAWLHLNTAISTSIAWLVAVIFAYVTNKIFVFQSKTDSLGALCREASLFFGARLLTYFIDLVGMILLVDILHVSGGLSKILCNILVLILNYVFSKLFVFQQKKD